MTEEEKKEQQRLREYYRSIYDIKSWLSLHVSQINYTRNLVLTFSVAALGYALSVYSKLSPQQREWGIWYNTRTQLLISIIAGVLTAGLQAENFRRKRIISRIIEKDISFVETNKGFVYQQSVCTILEFIIRGLAWVQIGFFLGGAYNLSIAIFDLKAI